MGIESMFDNAHSKWIREMCSWITDGVNEFFLYLKQGAAPSALSDNSTICNIAQLRRKRGNHLHSNSQIMSYVQQNHSIVYMGGYLEAVWNAWTEKEDFFLPLIHENTYVKQIHIFCICFRADHVGSGIGQKVIVADGHWAANKGSSSCIKMIWII